MVLQDTQTLPNGVAIPKLALGTWMIDDDKAAEAVKAAVEIGYRHIDTAQAYGNERGVGEGIRKASVPRDQVFVTTKFNRERHGFEGAKDACEASLKRLGRDDPEMLDADRFGH